MFVDKESMINRVSPSAISTYLDCPLSFYYNYILKIRLPQKQIHLEFGSAIHHAIDMMYKGSDNPILEFENKFDKNHLMDEEKNLYDEYIDLGKEMLENYFDIHPMLDKMYDLKEGESEKRVRRTLINPITKQESTLPISGILDRLTASGRIIEYKTSKNKWNPKETRFKVQNLMYNLWYYSEHGFLPKETVYIILLKKYKQHKYDQTYQVLTSNVTYDELAATFEEVELIISKIRHGIFDRPSGYHAKWCDCHRYERELNLKKNG